MTDTFKNSFPSRLHSVQKIILKHQLDAILFFDMSNIRYLTGFTGSDGVLIASSHDVRLLVDGRYTTQAASEVNGVEILEYENKIHGIEKALNVLGCSIIGFEAGFVNVEMHNDLIRRLKKIELIPLSDELRLLRAHKDKHEIAVMKKAATIASGAVAALAKEIRPGWTELETALNLEILARRMGAEQIAFSTIVASGKNSALPHAKPSNRKIRKGDLLVIDFGVRYHGYCSDETCTLAIGELTADQKNAYRATLRAHDEAIACIRSGIVAADVDRLVRDVFGKKYRRFFVHGTGHGVGLEVHEAPRLGPHSEDILTAGMVITVEPGLYYPGMWGIRIEDTVFVKKNGCEIITKMDKKLITIE